MQMGESVFEGCTGLTSGDWSARYIRPGTFLDCVGLKEFTIKEGVGEISSDAFSRCKNLAVVRIAGTVGTIGPKAFSECENLKDVYYYRESLPDYCYDNVFENSYVSYATLHVPASAIEAYQQTLPWSTFGTIVALP
jgi:hypothetical protein